MRTDVIIRQACCVPCFLLQATKSASPLMLLIYFSSCLLACDLVENIFRTFCDEFLAVRPMFTFRNIDATHTHQFLEDCAITPKYVGLLIKLYKKVYHLCICVV